MLLDISNHNTAYQTKPIILFLISSADGTASEIGNSEKKENGRQNKICHENRYLKFCYARQLPQQFLPLLQVCFLVQACDSCLNDVAFHNDVGVDQNDKKGIDETEEKPYLDIFD